MPSAPSIENRGRNLSKFNTGQPTIENAARTPFFHFQVESLSAHVPPMAFAPLYWLMPWEEDSPPQAIGSLRNLRDATLSQCDDPKNFNVMV